MKKTTSAGILLVGAIASLYLIGKGGAIGGGGAEKVGAILGSPGGLALPSAGTGSQKQIAAVTGYMAPGTKTAVTPEMRKEYGVGFVPSKTKYAGRQVSPTYIPEAATQAYVKAGGTGYVAPTFKGVGGTITGGAYFPPSGLYPGSKKSPLDPTAWKAESAAWGAKREIGVPSKKKVSTARPTTLTRTKTQKGTASAQKAAYMARKG